MLSAVHANQRHERLDALRGVAVLWMAIYHFCYDLNFLGLIQPRQFFFSDPYWTGQRTAIVSLFVFCAGLSMAVALQQGQSWQRFWRRWLQVALCAALVSAGSALMFPKSWIGFGILHGLAVMLVLARLLERVLAWRTAGRHKGWAALGAMAATGVMALLLPRWVKHPFFDTPWTHWVGLVTRPPVTEDWVPVLPWLGVMLLGLAAGQALLQSQRHVLAGPLLPALQPLATLGRWSLTFYMLHQPVLLGLLLGGRQLGWW